MTTLQTALRL